jgi:hypothetical protein
MRRRLLYAAGIVFTLGVVCAIALLVAVQRSLDARNGPTHHFAARAGDTFLMEDHALELARQVMSRDGFSDEEWTVLSDDRSNAPDGRADEYMVRNPDNPNNAVLAFVAGTTKQTRFIHIEWRNGEVVAQGTLGK